MAALGAAIDSVVPGFTTFIGFLSSNIMPILAGLGAMVLMVVVPAIASLIPVFYAWAAAAVASAITTTIAMAPIVLPILAIGAAVALLAAAWQNNWGGIQEKTAAVWAFLQPAFDQLVAWLSANLPIAISALAALWTGTLWPALQIVGGFIVGTLVPILVRSTIKVRRPALIQLGVFARAVPCRALPRRAVTCPAAPCPAAFISTLPNQLAPVRRNDTILECRRNHAPVALVSP